jgi:hypothetical protein
MSNKSNKFAKGKGNAKKSKGGSNKKAGAAKEDCPLANLYVTVVREDKTGNPNFSSSIIVEETPAGKKKTVKAKCDQEKGFLKLMPGSYDVSAKPPESTGYSLDSLTNVSLGAGDKKKTKLELKRVKVVEVTPTAKREQFINLRKAKSKPEHGRVVKVEAKLDKPLKGVTVNFDFEAHADNFDESKMKGSQKAKIKKSAKTDKKGIAKTNFTVSAAGGDQFKVLASLHPNPKHAAANPVKSAWIEVWRKVWYQFTHDKAFAVPDPADSVKAWKADNVGVKFEKADRVQFEKKDAPARTYYPDWMFNPGGGDREVAVIGGHNRSFFRKRYKKEKDKPVKAHLVICEYQWDPGGNTRQLKVDLSASPSSELEMSGSIINPPLKGKLVAKGSWQTKSLPKKKGTLKDENIIVEKTRSGRRNIKIQLPAEAPAPAPGAEITVKIVLKAANGPYLGESDGKQILAVYDSSDVPDFNDTVTHEVAHSLNQTPTPGRQPGQLPKHPHQYTGRGGQGSHCSTVVGGGKGTLVKVTNKKHPWYNKKIYVTGICVMFHSGPQPHTLHKFCEKCVPYVQLQDMSRLK